jgi:hypothetical protein
MMLSVIRLSYPRWPQAEKQFDDFFGFAKQKLKEHYDTNGNRGLASVKKELVFPGNGSGSSRPH